MKKLLIGLVGLLVGTLTTSGDNYSDQPQKLGGGGARLACGIIER